ncbi:cache domain-containing sensor histidine kinase [Candidatus Epulonipiscium viviparus]|uniref:cache domain-containing sensor histidine kinase n=1 Tax=Candidatus Epulonipiscium viviparus TaxID=420336 RepID=UPI002738099E|nr:sensor histidine kinase [Candidatus Epulopiscium viviparus]
MNKLQIRTKIILIYIAVLILTFSVTAIAIANITQRYIEQEVRGAGKQTISALAENLNFIFDNVTQFSNLIYFDDDVQESLISISQDYIEPKINKEINQSLSNIILSADYIASAFVFDKYLNSYSAYKVAPIYVDPQKITQTDWYTQMKAADGNGFFVHRSENVLQFPYRDDLNYISYIREIGNKENYEPIAILLLTIEAETFHKFFDKVSSAYDSQFFIVDATGEFIIPPKENVTQYQNYVAFDMKNGEVVTVADHTAVVVSKKLPHAEWTLMGSFKIRNIGKNIPFYAIIIGIMLLNIVVAVLYSAEVNRMIFDPLDAIALHMKLIETGKFVEMPVELSENEITRLKKVFNHMAASIEMLIEKVKEEEHVNAKSEINLIQAQINPHFLYNTLDAVSALALMEDHKKCFQMVQALGKFYRNSLNSGRDFITIEQEVASIVSYITILNIRYDNKIQFSYDIEEELKPVMMLKLLLQPVVENAVYHGIKEKEGSGAIHIKIYRDEDEIIFIITDDGCGMDDERIEQVLNGNVENSGFGIYSLIQRVKLYYHIENPIAIYSEIESGTEFIIRIKVV